MARTYADPSDQSGIYMNALDTRMRQMSQPNPFAQMLPGMIEKQGQNLTVMLARRKLSDYMGLPDEEKQLPQNKASAANAALSLGMNPMMFLAPKPTALDVARVKQAGAIEAINQKEQNIRTRPASTKIGANDLTPEETNALKMATMRPNNPLAASMIAFRGPRAKIMAQALLADPNWSPNKGESNLTASKQGASSAARLEAAGPPQILARYANSTKEVLKVAEEASKNYPRFGAQFLNTPYNKLSVQTSPEALQFKQVIADLRGHIAAVLAKGYAPQQAQIDEAMRYIPDSITPKQLTEDIPFLNRLIDIQVKGMMTPVSAPAQTSSRIGKDPMGLYK